MQISARRYQTGISRNYLLDIVQYIRWQLAGYVLGDEGMPHHLLDLHALLRLLLHDLQNEILGLVRDIHVVRELYLVDNLDDKLRTILLRSSSL